MRIVVYNDDEVEVYSKQLTPAEAESMLLDRIEKFANTPISDLFNVYPSDAQITTFEHKMRSKYKLPVEDIK